MKVQIRKSVFETNSSSQHSLVMRKKKDVAKSWELLRNSKKEITIGLTSLCDIIDFESKFVINIGELDMQKKLDMLFYSCFGEYNAIEFCKDVDAFVKIFKDEGIDIHFDFGNMLNDDYTWCLTNGEVLGMINGNVNTKEDVEQFLFSDEVFFTSYADDCMKEPEEIRKLYEYFDALPEEDVLFAHERD